MRSNKDLMIFQIISRCTECDKICNNSYQLQKHKDMHTKKQVEKEKKFACNTCGEAFTAKYKLDLHIKDLQHMKKNETDDTEYEKFILENFDMKCDLCDTIFTTFHEARRHYKEQHNEDKGYIKCCETKFRENSAVKSHVKSHLMPDLYK